MKKLFDDKETFQKERPSCLPNSHFKKLCDKLAKDIVANQYHSDWEEVSENLQEHADFSDDGYENAKLLEDNCSYGYTFNSSFVEHLDSLGYERDNAIEKLVKEWVQAHNPKPKYNKGDKLRLDSKLSHRKDAPIEMYITGIKESTAKYLMHEEKDYKGGYVYNYERVEEITTLIPETP